MSDYKEIPPGQVALQEAIAFGAMKQGADWLDSYVSLDFLSSKERGFTAYLNEYRIFGQEQVPFFENATIMKVKVRDILKALGVVIE